MTQEPKSVGLVYGQRNASDYVAEEQRQQLLKLGCAYVFVQRGSGDEDWTARKSAFKVCLQGDTVHVLNIWCLAKSIRDLASFLINLRDAKVHLRIESYGGKPFDTREGMKLDLADLVAGIADFETAKARERNFTGLKAAKQAAIDGTGNPFGRPRISNDIIQSILTLHGHEKQGAQSIADALKVSRGTVYNVLRENKVKQK
jgi:DNA invertase Pin-like site-specific DNA recombinase